MRGPAWSDEHERLVAATAPPVVEPDDAEVARVWARVRPAEDTAPRRTRRWRVVVGASVVTALVASSGVATAELLDARTGRGPSDAEDLLLGGPGEKLLPAASDYGEVVAEETADIPFPSVEARGLAVLQQVRDARGAGWDEAVSTGAVRAWVADAAVCAWSNQWAVATREGDEVSREEAIDRIQEAPSWAAVVAIDPDPFRRRESHEVVGLDGRTRTQHYWDESQFHYLAALGEAVETRDPRVVATLLAESNGYCRGGLVRDLPAANPLNGGVEVARTPTAAEFEELYAATVRDVLAYVRRRTSRDAEDLVAEVYAVGWRRRADLPAPMLRRAWLFGVARRLLLADGRRVTREAAVAEDLARTPSDEQPTSDQDRRAVVVAAAIGRLGPADREILRLTAWEGLTPAELATALGVRPATARVRLHRARRALAGDPEVRALVEPGPLPRGGEPSGPASVIGVTG